MKTNYQKLFIAGDWRTPQHGTEPVINPATEFGFATAPVAGIEDCHAALAAARTAFDRGPWPRLHRTERVAALRKLLDRCCLAVMK